MKKVGTALVAASLLAMAPQAQAAEPPKQPPLIVTLVVDQFSLELFERYRSSFTGGMDRLAKGISFTGYQSHAATETCPGHSTILTGRHPAGTGIIANTWFDEKTGSSIYCVATPGVADPEARGPQNLVAPTFGEWLKQARPGSRMFSISGKDRAAITLAGHKPGAVYWWVDGKGFATSRYAGPVTPKVLAPATAFDKALFARWRTSPPELWTKSVPAACEPLEKSYRFGELDISGTVPPDAAKTVEAAPNFLASADFQDQLRVSPLFDTITIDFASDVIDANHIGHGPATDVLAVSLSATDYIGHRYGNGGAEMCVQMNALDKSLAKLFTKLDSLKVPYVVVLTADHGGSDAAERAVANNPAAKRVDGSKLIKALNEQLRKAFDLTYDPAIAEDAQQISINMPGNDATRGKVILAAKDWLKQRPEVAAVFTADEVAAATPQPGTPVEKLSLAERFHESYYPGRSGEIAVALNEFATIGIPKRPGDVVAGHGSPWDYDRRVPILFWWNGVGEKHPSVPAETVDIAPTLSAIAGVKAPQLDGHCLETVVEACR